MKTSLKMKSAQKWHPSGGIGMVWVFGSALVLVFLALSAVVLIPRLRGPEPSSSQATWPPPSWRVGTLEEQGFDWAKMAEGEREPDPPFRA